MPSARLVLLLLAGLPAVALAQAGTDARGGGDPLRSPACLSARQALDAAMAEAAPAPQRLQALRQRVATACLQAAADPPRPARPARPPEAVAPITPVIPAPPPVAGTPRAPAVPLPPPVPQPPQVSRCDAGGCWDNSGQRLNRSGPYLLDPQGRMCTQQSTVLVCP